MLGGGWIEATVSAELEAGLTARQRVEHQARATQRPPSIAQERQRRLRRRPEAEDEAAGIADR